MTQPSNHFWRIPETVRVADALAGELSKLAVEHHSVQLVLTRGQARMSVDGERADRFEKIEAALSEKWMPIAFWIIDFDDPRGERGRDGIARQCFKMLPGRENDADAIAQMQHVLDAFKQHVEQQPGVRMFSKLVRFPGAA